MQIAKGGGRVHLMYVVIYVSSGWKEWLCSLTVTICGPSNPDVKIIK